MNARNQEVNHSLCAFDSRPPARRVFPISLQHITVMFLGIVIAPIVIAGATGANATIRTIMIQYSLMVSTLTTMIQVRPLGPAGSRLPIIFCAGFIYVPVFTPITVRYSLPGVFSAQLLYSIIAIALGFCVGRLHKSFPTVVISTIILSIGLSLYPIALEYMAGSASSPTYGQLNNWAVVFITPAAVPFFNLTCKGVVKMTSVLLGAVVGYVLALCMDMVHFDGVVSANWLAVPKPFFYGILSFDLSMVLPILLITIVNTMRSVGDIAGTTVGGSDREPRSEELTGGVTASGIATLVDTIFGASVVSSFSQNVDIMSMNKVVSRRAITVARAIIPALGVVPKFSTLVSTLPAPVIGGGTLTVFGMITLTGFELVSSEPLTTRDSIIVGISIALAMGLSTPEGTTALENFPPLAQTLLFESVATADVMSFLLSLLAPGEAADEGARERAALDAE